MRAWWPGSGLGVWDMRVNRLRRIQDHRLPVHFSVATIWNVHTSIGLGLNWLSFTINEKLSSSKSNTMLDPLEAKGCVRNGPWLSVACSPVREREREVIFWRFLVAVRRHGSCTSKGDPEQKNTTQGKGEKCLLASGMNVGRRIGILKGWGREARKPGG